MPDSHQKPNELRTVVQLLWHLLPQEHQQKTQIPLLKQMVNKYLVSLIMQFITAQMQVKNVQKLKRWHTFKKKRMGRTKAFAGHFIVMPAGRIAPVKAYLGACHETYCLKGMGISLNKNFKEK